MKIKRLNEIKINNIDISKKLMNIGEYADSLEDVDDVGSKEIGNILYHELSIDYEPYVIISLSNLENLGLDISEFE